MKSKRCESVLLIVLLLVVLIGNLSLATAPVSYAEPRLIGGKIPAAFLGTLDSEPRVVRVICQHEIDSGIIGEIEKETGNLGFQFYRGRNYEFTARVTQKQALRLVRFPFVDFITSIAVPTTPTEWAREHTRVDELVSQYPELDGEGITIAVIGTGANNANPRLDGDKVKAFADARFNPIYVDDTVPVVSWDCADYPGHDTGMCQITAGWDRPGYIHEGIAPEARLVVVNVIANDTGDSWNTWVRGVTWVKDNAAHYSIDIVVIYMVWTHSAQCYYSQDDAAQLADSLWTDEGLILISPAGNRGDTRPVSSPSAAKHTISVGAVIDPARPFGNWQRASFSSYKELYLDWNGEKPQVMAPGEGIWMATSAWPYLFLPGSGTCPAAAFIAGMCALLIQDDPTLKDDNDNDGIPDVADLLMASALPVTGEYDGAGLDEKVGAGRFDAINAHEMLHTDISSTKSGAYQLLDYGQLYNEPLWGKDNEDWYKRYLYAGWTLVMTIDCDPDLSMWVKVYRDSTQVSCRYILFGQSDTIQITASSNGWYYWKMSLRHYNYDSGDYYDIDWYVSS